MKLFLFKIQLTDSVSQAPIPPAIRYSYIIIGLSNLLLLIYYSYFSPYKLYLKKLCDKIIIDDSYGNIHFENSGFK